MDEHSERSTGIARGSFAAKCLVLVATLAVAATLVFLAARWLRAVVLQMPAKDSGEWASLLGGGFAMWAFFLIRSGIVDKALDLVPKARDMLLSLRSPGWSGFGGRLGSFARAMALPGIVTVFALVFVGEGVGRQIVSKPPVPTPDVHVKIDELKGKVELLSKRIEDGLGQQNLSTAMSDLRAAMDLRGAMTEQGYTERRAGLLDNLDDSDDGSPPRDAVAGRLAVPGCASEYYFARFPVSFDRARLNEARTALVAGVDAKSVRNPELVDRIVGALLPCGTEDGTDPVVVKVEGYASSERFRIGRNSVDDSDAWNIRTANERRRTVARMLEKAVGKENVRRIVICESDDYETLAEMQREREFNDRPRGQTVGRLPQDLLTLAAHVKVLHPGICGVRKES